MKKTKTVFSFFIFIFCSTHLHADDGALKSALDKANRGETQAAIRELQSLKNSNPTDGRIALSLGLLYQSTDQIDNALSELERARSLQPSLQGDYALGLLYESKWLKTEQDAWRQKAAVAWQNYLTSAPSDDPKRSMAEKHLQKVQRP